MMTLAMLLLSALLTASASPADSVSHVDDDWDRYKKHFQKHYKDADDEAARRAMFEIAKARVENLNKLNGQKAFGINWMSDRYSHEKYKKGYVRPKNFKADYSLVKEYSATRAPKAINWRYTEAVTAIKNQGQCGSCWAFSATEAIESQLVLASGAKVKLDLSPQQIASCAPSTGTYGCQGCNGGFTEGAYEYVKSVAGLANSFYIPYEQSLTQTTPTASCPATKVASMDGEFKQLTGGFASLSGYHYALKPCVAGECEKQDLAKLQAALEHTPVSVCVNAGVWNDYVGGVMTSAACGPMGAAYQDHCVMATGFNTTAPTPYWIVRNSWASTWGEDGYVYLEMKKNTCGLADDVTIPEVSLEISADEVADVAARREAMYVRATRGPYA